MFKLASLSLLLIGCSSYDPDLGPTPFKCGTEEPRCPENFTCDDTAMPAPICVANSGGSGSQTVDASTDNFQCANETGIEPNDTIETAFVTPVAGSKTMYSLGPISICMPGDKDHYKIQLATTSNVEVITSWESGMPVSTQILGPGGSTLVIGTAMGSDKMRACGPGLTAGVYYAAAFAGAGVRNNYRIEINIVPGC